MIPTRTKKKGRLARQTMITHLHGLHTQLTMNIGKSRFEHQINSLKLSGLTAFIHWNSRQLLGTEEDSSDRDSDEESGDPSGGGGDHRKNVWNITKEQLNYYTTQFFSMQTNPEGVIPGNQVLTSFYRKINVFKEIILSDLILFQCLKYHLKIFIILQNNVNCTEIFEKPICTIFEWKSKKLKFVSIFWDLNCF